MKLIVNIMKKSFQLLLFLAFAGLIALSSCNNDDDDNGNEPTPSEPEVRVQFDFVFGQNALPFSLGETFVHPRTGDTLSFHEFKFYLSNVKLRRTDGSFWEEAESYHLVCTDCPNQQFFIIENLPAGEYDQMTYVLGVDSARNVSGAQTGELSPSRGMFWDWNNGYIMLKAEGHSRNSKDSTFAFHLGGFSGDIDIVTQKVADFEQTLKVENGTSKTLNFIANPARLWHNSPGLEDRNTIHMPGPAAAQMGRDFFDNVSYVGME